MSKTWRGLLAALRRSSPLAREIAAVLLVKTVLLSLLLHALSSGPAPGRPRLPRSNPDVGGHASWHTDSMRCTE